MQTQETPQLRKRVVKSKKIEQLLIIQPPLQQLQVVNTEQIYQNSQNGSNSFIIGASIQQALSLIQANSLMFKIFNLNTNQIKSRLLDTLIRMPSKTDCPGYVYGFMNFHENGPFEKKFFIKMGRTKHSNPQTRIYQWEQQDKHEYTEIFTIRSEFNKKLQALVHLLFNYARKRRTINDKLRIQWFWFEQRVMASSLVGDLNQIMYLIQQPQLSSKIPKFINQIEGDEHKYNLNRIFKQIKLQKKGQNLIVIVGLGECFNKNVQWLLEGHTVKVIKKNILSKEYKKITLLQEFDEKYKVELIPQDNDQQNVQNALIRYFKSWFSVYSAKKIKVVNVLKQSDLQSSCQIGLTNSIQNLKQKIQFNSFIQNKEKIRMYIADVDQQLNVENVQQFIKEYSQKQKLSEPNLLNHLEYCLIPKENSQGQIKFQKIQHFQFSNLNNRSCLNFSSKLLKQLCNKIIINHSEELSKIFQKKIYPIKQQLKKLSLENKVQFIINMENQLKILKNSKQHHQIFHCYQNLLQSLKFISLNSNDYYLANLCCFCESICNVNMGKNNVLYGIEQGLNQMKVNIREHYDQIISQSCKKIANIIDLALKLYEDKKQQNLQNIKRIYSYAQKIQNLNENHQFVEVFQNTEFEQSPQVKNMIKVIKEVKCLQSNGIKCKLIINQLKYCIFNVMPHNLNQKHQKKQRQQKYLIKQQRYLPKNQKFDKYIKKNQNRISEECKETQEKLKLPKFEKKKEISKSSRLSDLIQENEKKMTITRQQIIIDGELIKIKSDLVIMAKRISVLNQLSIILQFQNQELNLMKKKHHLIIIMAGQFQNIQKLHIIPLKGWEIFIIQIRQNGELFLIDEKVQYKKEQLQKNEIQKVAQKYKKLFSFPIIID